jgi:anti-sigma-K factor RskA
MTEPDDDLDLLAGEYVLGTLSPGEMRDVARRMDADPAFATRITAWQNRLAPLADIVDPVQPPASLWHRIDAGLAKTAPAAREQPGQLARLWHSVAVWRIATAAGFALAASLAFLIAVDRPVPVVATLLPTGPSNVAILVELPRPGHLRFVASGAFSAGDNHELELWVLPTGASHPTSLGVLPKSGREIAMNWHGPAALLVSMEPMGGSPTGQPTGPVVYKGALETIRD